MNSKDSKNRPRRFVNKRSNTDIYGFLQVLISDNSSPWEAKQIVLQQLHEYVRDEGPLFRTLEADLLALIKTEYNNLRTLIENPIALIVQNLLNLYHECLKQSYSRLLQNLFLKINHKLKLTFPECFDKDIKEIASRFWKQVDSDNLSIFLNIFEIREFINAEEMVPKITYLLKNGRKIERAANYIAILDLHSHFDIKDIIIQLCQERQSVPIIRLVEKSPELQKDAVKLCLANRNAKNAGDIVKEFGLNPHDFPTLIPSLKRSALRFHMNDSTWTQVEEKFCDQKEMEGYFVEELILAGKWNEALSIVKRHDLLEKEEYISKEIRDKILPYFSNPPTRVFEYLENKLFTHDAFAPTEELIGLAEPGTYWHLDKFGYDLSKDLFYIDDCESEAWESAVADILKADAVGFDSEFKFHTTRFDLSGTALLQIATEKKLYAIDSMKLIKHEKYNTFIKDLLSDEKIAIVGHTLSADLSKIREAKDDKEPLVVKNLVDISKIFRALYPQAKYSLAAICEYFLQKPMSKYEQISNWENRPLRKSQIHYALLDSVIVLVLLKKLKEDATSKGFKFEQLLEESEKSKKKASKNGGEEAEDLSVSQPETDATEESKDEKEDQSFSESNSESSEGKKKREKQDNGEKNEEANTPLELIKQQESPSTKPKEKLEFL